MTSSVANITTTKKTRNGLIELYRFFFAMVVVKNHGLFAFEIKPIGPGRACVEFFFVLSGYLFWSFLQKNKELPILQSYKKLLKSRLLPLAIPLCIGIASNIIASFYKDKFSLWRYLWYVETMFILMMILIIWRKLIKNDKMFTISLACAMLIATILKFFGPFYSWGEFRGLSSIPMGIILAMLPKIKFKRKWLILIPYIPVIVATFTILYFHWSDVLWFGYHIPELILDVILYPALIYITFCMDFKCKFFNYLGGLSFGLYAFQCTSDMLRVLGVENSWILFGVILFATLVEDAGKRIYRHARAKRIEK